MSVKVTIDRVASVVSSIQALASSQLLVGIPADKAARPAPEEGEPINNAQIGYLMEFGMPERNVPARPHLVPGIRAVQASSTIPGLQKAAQASLEGRGEAAQKYLAAVGQKAADSVRNTIRNRVPPPLAESTILNRLRRKAAYKNASPKRKATLRAAALKPGGIALAGDTPLLDTGQLYRAYTYIIRKKR